MQLFKDRELQWSRLVAYSGNIEFMHMICNLDYRPEVKSNLISSNGVSSWTLILTERHRINNKTVRMAKVD